MKRFRIFRIERGHYRNFETVWWFTRCRHHLRRAGLVPRRIDGRKKGLQISFFGWVALIDFDKWSSLCYWRATRKHPLKSGKWNVDKCHGFRKEGSTSDLKLDNATYITVVENIPKMSHFTSFSTTINWTVFGRENSSTFLKNRAKIFNLMTICWRKNQNIS